MNEIELIADQVAAGYRDGAWPGVSVRDLFRDLSASDAAAHPIAGAHSAWEIALHLGFWYDAVRRRIGGEPVEYAQEEDWPKPALPTAENWCSTLDAIDREHEALVETVRALPLARLAETVPGRTFSVYFMLHGVPQHDLYHGGQVVMLSRALRETAILPEDPDDDGARRKNSCPPS